jgi:hypothetical protein
VDAVDVTIANARAHVDAADIPIANAGAHVDATDVTIANAGAHVNAADVTITNAGAHVGAPSKLDAAMPRTQAKAALTGLGWKPTIAHAAVAAAAARSGADVTLEQLIRASLRHCPVPKA